MDDFEYGCVMAYYNIPNWQKIISQVNPHHVYDDEEGSYGKERENPHITILFGLEPEIPDNHIRRVVDKIHPVPMKVMGTSLFENEGFDVLKFDVESPYIRKLNAAFSMFPHEKTHEYKPHLTVSYLEKGVDEDYGDLHRMLPKKEFVSNLIVYSKTDGTKDYFYL